jgi:hypothetical protein
LIGTYVLHEVRFAVQKVYQVIEIFELFEYDFIQYDIKNGKGGLFWSIKIHFSNLQAETSGYPNWIRKPEDEDRYIQSLKPEKASCWIKMP